MKIEEAIKEIKSYADNSWGDLNKALEMAINALEKQIPQKPIEDGYYGLPCVCPCCGQALDVASHPTEKGGVTDNNDGSKLKGGAEE